MKLKLTTLIITPFLLIGLLVAAAFGTLTWIDHRLQSANAWSETLSGLQVRTQEITSRVQTGILTRDNEHAIAVAKMAVDIDTTLSGWLSRQPQAAPELLKQFQGFYAGVVAINSVFLENRLEEGTKRLGLVRQLQNEIDGTVKSQRDMALAAEQRLSALSQSIMLGTIVVLVGLTLFTVVFVRSKVVQPVRSVAESLEDIAHGNADLTAQLSVSSVQEIGLIGHSFNHLMAKLRGEFINVRMASESIKVASAEIASGNLDLSHRTEETASRLQETSHALQELQEHVHESAKTAQTANSMATNAADMARKGGTVVADVVKTMEEINHSSRRIADIIGVIDGIAFQTNILALNAAVEAARAGEQGRGFAVVASEVRSLAGRSAEASKEIKQLIDSSVNSVAAGTQLVADAGSTMDDVVASVQAVSETIAMLSATALDESGGIDRLTTAVASVDQSTQQNAALVEESFAAAQSLSDQATKLTEIVGAFKLD